MTQMTMKRHQLWRHKYEQNRYMSHLTREQLDVRVRYLVENLATLESNGKIGVRKPDGSRYQQLWIHFTHTHHEMVLRGLVCSPEFMKDSVTPSPAVERADELVRIGNYVRSSQPHLLKFGKRCHLEKGELKVSLASSYNDPSLNDAQKDDELALPFLPDPAEIEIKDRHNNRIEGVESVTLTLEAQHDFYVFCSSSKFDYRLFNDFGADCCLLIFDSERFASQLMDAISERVEIIDHGYHNVTYVDPVLPVDAGQLQMEFSKHIKFLYQNEYRHVFIPQKGQSLKQDVFVNLEGLHEYSEVVCF